MRRVVITGSGIVSSIGNNKAEVLDALRAGRSGIHFSEQFAERGYRSQVHGPIQVDITQSMDRKTSRYASPAAAYSYLAMQQALADAGLDVSRISRDEYGLIVGSGGIANEAVVAAVDTFRRRGPRKVSPFVAPKIMASTCSATLATAFRIKGISYSISSACSSSAHCIGHSAELIQLGKQDLMFAGGAEEVQWTLALVFDAMGALSSAFNATPERASRPYDQARDGFVISGGGGIVVLEELEHARRRGANIRAELVGYGASSDGFHIVQPSCDGAAQCMQRALRTVHTPIDYINAHGTGTPVGDVTELNAIHQVFGDQMPPISSTKSLTGHALGAAGVNEIIHCLLMLQGDFIAGSANIETLDTEATGMPIVQTRVDGAALSTVMSNSLGFGGTNASLVLRKWDG